jgi:hypothetical protein
MVNILHRSHSENKMDNLTYQTLIRLNPWLTKPGLWPEAIHKFLPLNYIPRALSLSFVPDKINLLITTLVRLSPHGRIYFLQATLKKAKFEFLQLNLIC